MFRMTAPSMLVAGLVTFIAAVARAESSLAQEIQSAHLYGQDLGDVAKAPSPDVDDRLESTRGLSLDPDLRTLSDTSAIPARMFGAVAHIATGDGARYGLPVPKPLWTRRSTGEWTLGVKLDLVTGHF